MKDRIMVKIERTEGFLYFRTVSRIRKSLSFAIRRTALFDVENHHAIACEDGGSFARIWLDRIHDEISIRFSWLSEHSDGTLTGWRQTVRLPYSTLAHFAAEEYDPEGENMLKLLSCDQDRRPAMVFAGQETLRAVIAIPMLRHKLFSCLNQHFHWRNSREIVLYNDFVPYSFFFRETLCDGSDGICGGVILHGLAQGKAKAYYSVHT